MKSPIGKDPKVITLESVRVNNPVCPFPVSAEFLCEPLLIFKKKKKKRERSLHGLGSKRILSLLL